MIRSVLAAAFGAACFLLVMGPAGPADAQGTFDCRRPGETYQRVVCADANLRAADLRLYETLGEALRAVSNPDSLRSEQTEWTQNLRNCSTDVLCLRDFYTDRTGALRHRTARAVEDQRVADPVVGDLPAPQAIPTTSSAVEPTPSEDLASETSPSPDQSYAETEHLPPVVDAEQAPATSVPTPSPDTITQEPAPTSNQAWSIPPWVMIAGGVSLFLLIGLSIHVLNISAERYGYDMMFNRMAPLHIVVAACVGLSFIVPLLFAPIALLTFGVILFNNIRRTNLLIVLAGSLIQPIALC